jgi:hypothetical protein
MEQGEGDGMNDYYILGSGCFLRSSNLMEEIHELLFPEYRNASELLECAKVGIVKGEPDTCQDVFKRGP